MTFQDILNNSGLAQGMSALQRAILLGAARKFGPASEIEEPDVKQQDRMILNDVGPAAAGAAIEVAIRTCLNKGQYKNIQFNGSPTHNVQLIQNDPGEYNNFSTVLRQFLLPRSAYLNFDNIVDPRHRIDEECGYPRFITPIMYRYIYDRDDVARRVNDIYPDESWAVEPIVYEDEDENNWTPFELAWKQLCDDFNILSYLYRLDRLAGIGHFGVLLIGVGDYLSLESPIDEPELLLGMRNSVARTQRPFLYVRPFDEYLSFVQQFETNINSPRYGLPKYYNLVFLDMTISAAGASIGTRLNRRVHWSRVVHVAENLQTSQCFGTPRMQPVFNRLLDLRKIKGGSAEMFWKGAFPGISFEVDPRFVADQPDFDKDAFREEIERYANGLQRQLLLMGVSAKTLSPQIADPSPHIKMQMEAISSHFGVPIRIFLGSEEGRLASSQDKLTWNQRLGKRIRRFVEPSIIRGFINHMIAIGCMPPPSNPQRKYFVDWGDLNTTTDEDKANLALKWTQALSQYVSSGVIHFMSPMDYMTIILGLNPRDAKRIDEYIKSSGGYEKLKKVDPSQSDAGGQNGVRKNNVSKGDRSGSSKAKAPKRNTADKKQEGSSG